MTSTNWGVRRNKQTYKEINAYFSSIGRKKYSADGTYFDIVHSERNKEYDYMIFPPINRSKTVVEELPIGYKELSFSEFKTFILKTESHAEYQIY